MIVWFCQWRQEQGWWPSFSACSFQVGALATAIIKTRVMSVTSEVEMTLGVTSLASPDHSPVPGRNGTKEPTSRMLFTACGLSCSLWSRQRSHLCLMQYWDMPLQLNQEAPPSKQAYHVPIYPRYLQVWVLLGTCLDLILNFDLAIMNWPWEEWH